MTGINLTNLKLNVVQPVLAVFPAKYNSRSAEVLLLGTGVHETNAGEVLRQIGGGPALGWLQMEPATYNDCWTNFLAYQPDLAAACHKFQVPGWGADQMVWNLNYAAAMARVRFIRSPDSLPIANDFEGLANYYKKNYNSSLGAAVVDADLIECFRQAGAA